MRLHYLAIKKKDKKIYLSVLKGVIKSALIFSVGFRIKTASLCKGWSGSEDGEAAGRLED